MTPSDFTRYFKLNYHNRTSSFLSGLMLAVSDAMCIFICLGICFFTVNLINPSAINFRSFIYYSAYFPLILIVYYASGLYPGIMISPSEEVRKLCICSSFCFIGICISFGLQDAENTSSLYLMTEKIIKDSHKLAVCCAFVLAIPLVTIALPASREAARHIYGHFDWWGVPAVIYCSGNSGDEVISRLSKRSYLGYKPAVIIDSLTSECKMNGEIPVFPISDEINKTIKELNIKVAILADFSGNIKKIRRSYRYCITINKNSIYNSSLSLRDIGGIIGFSSINHLTKKANLIGKRLIDLLILLFSFPFVFPVFLLLIFLTKITSSGPVFFGHTRVGKNGKTIKCWKFRSMYKNSQEMLEKILAQDPVRKEEWEKDRKFADDPRITKFGKFLRKTSLDELPQFINILAGEMSFVGPRPVTKDELSKYGDNVEYILSVTPGLSGMWQISGRSDTGYEERINLDSYYIQNWSVWLDLWIIIKTVWVVLKGKGAY